MTMNERIALHIGLVVGFIFGMLGTISILYLSEYLK